MVSEQYIKNTRRAYDSIIAKREAVSQAKKTSSNKPIMYFNQQGQAQFGYYDQSGVFVSTSQRLESPSPQAVENQLIEQRRRNRSIEQQRKEEQIKQKQVQQQKRQRQQVVQEQQMTQQQQQDQSQQQNIQQQEQARQVQAYQTLRRPQQQEAQQQQIGEATQPRSLWSFVGGRESVKLPDARDRIVPVNIQETRLKIEQDYRKAQELIRQEKDKRFSITDKDITIGKNVLGEGGKAQELLYKSYEKYPRLTRIGTTAVIGTIYTLATKKLPVGVTKNLNTIFAGTYLTEKGGEVASGKPLKQIGEETAIEILGFSIGSKIGSGQIFKPFLKSESVGVTRQTGDKISIEGKPKSEIIETQFKGETSTYYEIFGRQFKRKTQPVEAFGKYYGEGGDILTSIYGGQVGKQKFLGEGAVKIVGEKGSEIFGVREIGVKKPVQVKGIRAFEVRPEKELFRFEGIDQATKGKTIFEAREYSIYSAQQIAESKRLLLGLRKGKISPEKNYPREFQKLYKKRPKGFFIITERGKVKSKLTEYPGDELTIKLFSGNEFIEVSGVVPKRTSELFASVGLSGSETATGRSLKTGKKFLRENVPLTNKQQYVDISQVLGLDLGLRIPVEVPKVDISQSIFTKLVSGSALRGTVEAVSLKGRSSKLRSGISPITVLGGSLRSKPKTRLNVKNALKLNVRPGIKDKLQPGLEPTLKGSLRPVLKNRLRTRTRIKLEPRLRTRTRQRLRNDLRTTPQILPKNKIGLIPELDKKRKTVKFGVQPKKKKKKKESYVYSLFGSGYKPVNAQRILEGQFSSGIIPRPKVKELEL